MSENRTNINWFPGHMKVTERLIKENMSKVDLVIELIDARIPFSSRNPLLAKLINNKPRIVVLGKSDLADSNVNDMWIKYIAKTEKVLAIAVNCKNAKSVKSIVATIKTALTDLIKNKSNKGMVGRAPRAMIVGIPNVGKSTLINSLAGKNKAKAENRPGVTINKQWVSINGVIDLLDMPGTLWHKFEDPTVGLNLAYIGSIKDSVFDIEYVAMNLLEYLHKNYNDRLIERFNVDLSDIDEPFEKLEAVGRSRGMLVKGGNVDTERAAITVLEEYRSGKFGKITLEMPPNIEDYWENRK